MVALVPVENHFHNIFTALLSIVLFFGGFFLFVVGIDEIYQIGSFNFQLSHITKEKFLRVASAWAGMFVGAVFYQYIKGFLGN
jgi:hypothetical protein